MTSEIFSPIKKISQTLVELTRIKAITYFVKMCVFKTEYMKYINALQFPLLHICVSAFPIIMRELIKADDVDVTFTKINDID